VEPAGSGGGERVVTTVGEPLRGSRSVQRGAGYDRRRDRHLAAAISPTALRCLGFVRFDRRGLWTVGELRRSVVENSRIISWG
jgi:hypothetical protein